MYVWREERGSLSFAHVRPRAHLEVIRGVQDVVHPGDLSLARNGRPVLARVELLPPVDKKNVVIPIARTRIKISSPLAAIILNRSAHTGFNVRGLTAVLHSCAPNDTAAYGSLVPNKSVASMFLAAKTSTTTRLGSLDAPCNEQNTFPSL